MRHDLLIDRAEPNTFDDDLARCSFFLADALESPPNAASLARAAQAARRWSLQDSESTRGAALLVESALAGETPTRLRLDHDRLFVSRRSLHPGKPATSTAPIASPLAADLMAHQLSSAATVASLRTLYREAGLPPSSQPDHIAVALEALGDLYQPHAGAPMSDGDAMRLRRALLTEHLLVWGNRCLVRMQQGSQTFYYQGLAALGLGLLRAAANHSGRKTHSDQGHQTRSDQAG